MPTSQLSCVVRPFENSIVFDQRAHPNCLVWSDSSKIQYSLLSAHNPTVLCGPTLRKFDSLGSMPTSQLSCVVRPFENSTVFGQCPHPSCLVWSDPSKIQYSWINAHIPTVLCGPTLRKFHSLGSMPTTLSGPSLRKFRGLWSMPRSQLHSLINANCLVWSDPSKIQYSLINAHIPTVLCGPTLRKFNTLG